MGRKYVEKNYEEVFAIDEEKNIRELQEIFNDRSLAGNRTKTIKSGEMLEVEVYPFWNTPRKRRKPVNESRAAQKNLNDKNTIKHVTRLIHANFEEYEDIWLTLTYPNGEMPGDYEEAKKDMTNYIRRLKRWLKRNGYEKFELKYIYVTEHTRDGEKVRAHHHMVTNFPNRDEAEKIWGTGRTQSRRLQADDYGFEGMARYIVKEKGPKTMKRYTPSRNLKKPKETVSDKKISRRRAERIAKHEIDPQELFEKLYPGYSFNDIEVKFSDFTSGAYLYVRMKRIKNYTKKKAKKYKYEKKGVK